MHWAEAYVGRPWVAGEFDCADLVALVLRERFGRTIRLPARAAGVRGWDRQIAALKGAYAAWTAAPRDGDGVLMRGAGRRRAQGHHIGVWCAIAGEPHVLHCLKDIGTVLHPIRDLPGRQLELMGVYRWL